MISTLLREIGMEWNVWWIHRNEAKIVIRIGELDACQNRAAHSICCCCLGSIQSCNWIIFYVNHLCFCIMIWWRANGYEHFMNPIFWSKMHFFAKIQSSFFLRFAILFFSSGKFICCFHGNKNRYCWLHNCEHNDYIQPADIACRLSFGDVVQIRQCQLFLLPKIHSPINTNKHNTQTHTSSNNVDCWFQFSTKNGRWSHDPAECVTSSAWEAGLFCTQRTHIAHRTTFKSKNGVVFSCYDLALRSSFFLFECISTGQIYTKCLLRRRMVFFLILHFWSVDRLIMLRQPLETTAAAPWISNIALLDKYIKSKSATNLMTYPTSSSNDSA